MNRRIFGDNMWYRSEDTPPSDPEPNGDGPHDDPTKRDKPHPNGL